MSALALGTRSFGVETDELGAYLQLDRFIEAGGSLVDTVGVSEEVVGRWLRRRPSEFRDKAVIAARGFLGAEKRPDGPEASGREFVAALDASLLRLGVEAVDIYMADAHGAQCQIDEILQFWDDSIRAGKVRYAGLWNCAGWEVQKLLNATAARGARMPMTMEGQYNLLAREAEWEILPACRAEGLGMLACSALEGGWLTGKYRRDEVPIVGTRLGDNPGCGAEAYGRRNAMRRTWDVLEAVRGVAETTGVSMAQIALAWLLGREGVTSVVVGARTVEQLDESLAAAELCLCKEAIRRLDAASDPGAAYGPYQVSGDGRQDQGDAGA